MLTSWGGRGLDSGLPKTNPANGQTGNWTRGLRISSPAPLPLGNAASYKTTNYSYKTTTFPCSLKQNKQAIRSRTKLASFQLHAFWYFVDTSRKGLMCNAHLWWSEYWIRVFCNVHLPLRIFMHLMLPHDLVSCMSLWLHFLPPCRGSGLLHWRWRLLTPPPQVLEHWLNSDHLLRPPLTRNRRSTFNLYIGSIDTRGEVTPDESLRTSA